MKNMENEGSKANQAAIVRRIYRATMFFCFATAAGSTFAQIVLPASGYIGTIAGDGTSGYSGDNGAAIRAQLSYPFGVAVDGSGNVFLADGLNNRIREVVASTGFITTVVGGGSGCSQQTDSIGDGCQATSAILNYPGSVTLDGNGNIYFSDIHNQRIRKVTASTGVITTLAGGGSGCSQQTDSIGDGCQAVSAELNNPVGVAVDGSGNVYFADQSNQRVREVMVSTGIISTIAGNGTQVFSDGVAATSTGLNYPYGVVVDASGNVYIADNWNRRIREVTASNGFITTVAGGGSGCSQQTDSVGDGCPATSAELAGPVGVAVDSSGNIYIVDQGSERIRVVTASTRIITTTSGGGSGCSQQSDSIGDGCAATSAELNTPFGVAVDLRGNVYIADTYNQVVRAVGSTTITPPAATPTFTPAAGAYTSAQAVTISDATPGATIFYTINGTAPTTTSAVYSSPIQVFSTETLKAIATAQGYAQSPVASATYTISGSAPAANPSFFPPGGSYPGTLTAVITDPTPNVVIYYTTDGSTPTANGNGTQCSNDCLVKMSASTVVKAIATAPGFGQSAVSSVSYTLTAPTPIILGISPVAGPVGTSVTVSGENFGASGTVTFNGVAAIPTSWGIDSITVPVPAGAASGQIVITTNQGTSNGFAFTVGTGISGITPSAGTMGTSVIISGSGFGATQGNSVVTFNGVASTPSSWSDTSITAAVPPGATTGNVAVQINRLTATGPVFTVNPSISGLTPASGPIGAIVTISGSNFGAVRGGSTVTFGATPAIPTQWSPNVIVVPVPAGAVSGSVVVAVAGQSSNPVSFTVGSAVTGTISGTVTQSDGITPVAGATITVFQGSNSVATATTAANGTYSVSNLAAATYSVRANATGFGSGQQSNVSVSARQATVANLSLSGQRTISYAYDKDGRLTRVADSTGGYATYAYDPVGNITSISRSGSSQLAILGFSPTSGPPGATLSIVGTGFVTIPGNNSVTVNGASASVVSGTATQLVVTVPSGVTTGPIGVTNSNGSATSSGSFTVTSAGGTGAPSISSFTPTIGAAGTTVTISGSGFNSDPVLDFVQFNGQVAAVSSATTTSISAAVPAGAVSGPLSVQTSGGTAVSSSSFAAIPLGYTQSNVDFAGQLAVGGSYTGTINTAGHIGLVSFTATAGQEVNLEGTNVTLSQTNFSILKPDGSPLTQRFVEDGVLYSGSVPVSGSYEIVISQTTTGSATLVLSTNTVGTIASGTPSNVTISTPGQNAALTFSGTQGQLASIQLSGGTFNVGISIISPNGGTLFSTSSSSSSGLLGPIALPATGTYTLIVIPTGGNTGSISVNLSLFSNQAAAISPGVPTSVAINLPGQTAQWSFAATAGQSVSVSISNSTICAETTDLKLLSPDGSTFTSIGAECSSSFLWFTPTLPSTGTYTLLMAPLDGATGNATVTITLLNEPPPSTITPGTSTGLTINTPGQIAQWTFTGNQGQFASVQLSNSSFTGFCALSAKILNPDGSTLTAGGLGCGESNLFLAPVVLPKTGTYTIVVAPIDGSTGSVTVLLSLFNEQIGTTISAGTPVGITINTPGQDAQLTLTATAGQLASVQLSGSGFPDGDVISIIGPEGTTLASGSGLFLGPVTLPVTGTYTLVIAPNNGDTGNVTVSLSYFSNLTGNTLSSGTPANVTINTPGQNTQLTFSGTQGQWAGVQLSNIAFTNSNCVKVSIIAPDSTALTSPSSCGSSFVLPSFTLPTTGTYTVVISPQSGGTGTATVNLSLSTLQNISLNAPTTLTVTTPGQPTEAIFSGLIGQRATVQISSVSFNVGCSTVAVNLLSPTGATIGTGNACNGAVFQNPIALSATGFYILQIVPPSNGSGSVTLTVTLAQVQSGTLTAGTPTNIAIAASDKNAQLTFTGTQGQLASIVLVSSSIQGSGAPVSGESTPSWISLKVISPDGTVLASNSGLFVGPITLPATGTYTVVISLISPSLTGNFSVLLTFFNDINGSITAGTPRNITINAPGQGAKLTFTGSAGQWASVQLSGPNVPSGASLRILNPDGTTLATGSGSFIGPVTLPVNGTYTLVITPLNGSTGIVTVSLSLSGDLTGTTISPGTPVGLTIEAVEQNSQLTFNGTAGELASVQVQGPSFPDGLSITILGPDGTALTNNNSTSSPFLGPVLLPASGTYSLVVSSPVGTGVALAQLWLFNNVTGTIVPGTPFGVNISSPGQAADLSFSGTAGQTVGVQLSNVTFALDTNEGGNLAISILNPDGTTLISNNPIFGEQALKDPAYGLTPVTLPVTGVYTLIIAPQNGDAVLVNFQPPPPPTGSAVVGITLQ